jgi:hypothetical protein
MYYGRTENEHVDLHLALLVEGVPYAFVERTIPGSPTAIGTRTQVPCIVRAEEGEAVLDLIERREMAATLDIEMLDTDDDLFRTLFAAGSRAVTWIQTDFTDSDTDLEVTDAAAVSNGDVVYIGDETIVIGTVSGANDWLGCTRGAFGSTARALYGTSETGDNVYTVPPHWKGRRASLYAYAPDAKGIYTETLLGTYIVDESPRHVGDKRWAMRLAGIVQEYWERVCGLGIEAATFTGIGTWDFTGAEPVIDHPVTDASKFRLSQTIDSYVIAQTEFGSGIHKLIDVDLGGTITLAYDASFQTVRAMQATSSVGDVRQIAVVQLPGAAGILSVLLSDEGQALSGGDYLPGRAPSESSDLGWRLGTGFAASEVDSTAFGEVTAIPPMTIIIDGERKVTDILREWCFLTGTAIVTTVDGKIKPVPIGSVRGSSPTTIGAADVIPEGQIEVTHDEGTVFPIIKAQAGYSPITGEFHDELNLVDADLAKRYRRAPQVFDIELRSIDVWEPRQSGPSSGWRHPTRQRAAAMVTMLSDLMRAAGGARRLVRLSLPHEHLNLRLGDVVIIGTDLPDGYDELPDMRGSTLRGATCRVVARRPRYDQARVDVQLEIMDRLLHVCPAATIASAGTTGAGPNGGTVLTLATTTPEVSGTSPSDDFYVGAVVIAVDRSTPANTEALSVASIPSSTTIEVDNPGFTIQNNVDYVVLDPELSANGTTASGYALIELAKLADVDGTAGGNANTDNEPRWR